MKVCGSGRSVRASVALAGVAAAAAAVLGGMALSGCGPKVVPPSGPRAATEAARVKIYQEEPAKYEKLGAITVRVTPEMRFDVGGESNPGFEALKAQAAKLGANGVLLRKADGEFDVLATVGYQGTFYQVPMRTQPRTALAEAIFVVKE